MANKSKAKGTAFETATVKYLIECGYDAARLPLHGAEDCGDVVATSGELFGYVIENKAHKIISRQKIKMWREQTLREAKNYNKKYNTEYVPLLIVKSPGQSIKDSIVHIQEELGSNVWVMHYMDEYFGQEK